MITEEEINNEEDVINLLTKITNMKSLLVNHVIRQHERFENLDIEIQDIVSNFDVVHKKSEDIIKKSSEIKEQIFQSATDKEKYQNQINCLIKMKEIVTNLISLNKLICELQSYSVDNIHLSVENIDKIGATIGSINENLRNASCRNIELKAYNTLIVTLANVKGDLTSKVERVWESNIKINRNMSPGNVTSPHCTSIAITLSPSIFQSLLRLMFHLDIGYMKIGLLLRFVVQELLYQSLDQFAKCVLEVKIDDNGFFLTSTKVEAGIRQSSLFIEDFTNALTGLNSFILSVPVPSKNVTVMDLFHQEYFDLRFTEYMIDSFFNAIVIDQSLLLEIRVFIGFLQENNFISSANQRLTEFVESYDRRARENDVTSLLSEARKLFSESILNCNAVSNELISGQSTEKLVGDIILEMNQLKLIDINQVLFPVCKVSTSVINSVQSIIGTIHLFETAIYENNTEQNLVAARDFLHILPEIMMMYLYVVPLTNKDVLEKLPLASVLHYNNCMYLAHHCMFWSTEIKPLIDIVKRQVQTDASTSSEAVYHVASFNLLPLVYLFRNAATECLTREIEKQKSIISEFFDNIDSFSGIGSENKERVGKVIKKCNFHLTSLSSIYSGFPDKIFDFVFASICDWTTDLILRKVLDVTDIIMKDIEPLIALLTEYKEHVAGIIWNRLRDRTVKQINRDNGEHSVDEDAVNIFLSNNCAKWGKLRELLFLLGHGLQDIEERWTDGKVTMSQHISAVEVRNMIKAIFKNNHIRSKVLEKIV